MFKYEKSQTESTSWRSKNDWKNHSKNAGVYSISDKVEKLNIILIKLCGYTVSREQRGADMEEGIISPTKSRRFKDLMSR